MSALISSVTANAGAIARALCEQFDAVWQGQGGKAEDVFAADVEPSAARAQKFQAGASLEQPGQVWCRFEKMLQIVEHDKQVKVAANIRQTVDRRLAIDIRYPQGFGDRRGNEPRVANRGQGHVRHPVREGGSNLPRHLDRESGLAHAPGTLDRDQPDLVTGEKCADRLQLPFTANEAGQWPRQLRIAARERHRMEWHGTLLWKRARGNRHGAPRWVRTMLTVAPT